MGCENSTVVEPNEKPLPYKQSYKIQETNFTEPNKYTEEEKKEEKISNSNIEPEQIETIIENIILIDSNDNYNLIQLIEKKFKINIKLINIKNIEKELIKNVEYNFKEFYFILNESEYDLIINILNKNINKK